jgi:uncharacterized protein (DUF433 family)
MEGQEKLELEFSRITRKRAVMGGKPCIRGMRVTVGMIVGQIGAGTTIEEVLSEFLILEREDILEAIQYAGALASNAKNEVLSEDEESGDWITLDLKEER